VQEKKGEGKSQKWEKMFQKLSLLLLLKVLPLNQPLVVVIFPILVVLILNIWSHSRIIMKNMSKYLTFLTPIIISIIIFIFFIFGWDMTGLYPILKKIHLSFLPTVVLLLIILVPLVSDEEE
jgi:hypothetical protein